MNSSMNRGPFEAWCRTIGHKPEHFVLKEDGTYKFAGVEARYEGWCAGQRARRQPKRIITAEDTQTIYILEAVVRAYEKHDGLKEAAARAKAHLRKRAEKEEKAAYED